MFVQVRRELWGKHIHTYCGGPKMVTPEVCVCLNATRMAWFPATAVHLARV